MPGHRSKKVSLEEAIKTQIINSLDFHHLIDNIGDRYSCPMKEGAVDTEVMAKQIVVDLMADPEFRSHLEAAVGNTLDILLVHQE